MTNDLIKRAEGWRCGVNSPVTKAEAEAFRIIQDLLTAIKGKGWLPIAELPKGYAGDILVFDKYEGIVTARVNKNSELEPSWGESSVINYMSDFGTEYKDIGYVTHFMHLPTPPNDSEEK